MSEYDYVEKPFLDQLAALGWQVIDQGSGIPQNPARSHRTSFREVILNNVFRDSVRAINTLPDDQPWLTVKQLDELLDQITHQPGNSLFEANEAILKLLYRTQVDELQDSLIGEVLDVQEARVRSERLYLEKLITLKTGLMQDILSGKVRVKVDESQETAMHV